MPFIRETSLKGECSKLLSDPVAESALREDLKPGDMARVFQASMTLTGWSSNLLAKELVGSQSSASDALILLGFVAPALAAVATSVLSSERQVEVKDAYAVGPLWNRAELKARVAMLKGVESAEGKPARSKPLPTSRMETTSGGLEITYDHRQEADKTVMLAATEGVAARLRAGQAGEAEAA